MEFDKNGFSAEMKAEKPHETSIFGILFNNKYLTFIFGCSSLVLSFVLIGMYTLCNYIINFVMIRDPNISIAPGSLIFIMIPYFMIALLALSFSITTMVSFKKRNLGYPLTTLGLIFSIISFVVCIVFLVLSILLVVLI